MTIDLLTPLKLGPYTLPNRVFMAPLTRCRAGPGEVPHALNAEYYRQRASAGLIISEATQIAPEGRGYPATPGIHTPGQVAGWQLVTAAVRGAGGRIYCQLWHVGRTSHSAYQPGGKPPVSASAIPLPGDSTLPDGTKKPHETPRALESAEIAGVIGQYRHAAQCALEAGFDGVELHGANGYLPDQFLRDGTNQRTDLYGGSVENRARFHLEATQALIDIWGAGRVGVRLSPSGAFNSMRDSNARATFGHVVRELDKLNVGYLHIMEASEDDQRHAKAAFPAYDPIPVSFFRPMYRGVLIVNGGFTFEKATAYLREGWADAFAFGTAMLANPDLPERFRRIAAGNGVPLNTPDPASFYGGAERGYTDYSFLPS